MKKKTEKQVVGVFFISLAIIFTYFIVDKYGNLPDTENIKNENIQIHTGNNISISASGSSSASGSNKISNIPASNQVNIIPKQFDICIKETDKISCIISLDVKTGETDIMNLMNKQFVSQRLDQIDSFKDSLGIPADKAEKSFAGIFQDLYTLRKPEIIYENFQCKTNFCKTVIIDTKKMIIENLGKSLLKSVEECKKIDEIEAQNQCKNLFK